MAFLKRRGQSTVAGQCIKLGSSVSYLVPKPYRILGESWSSVHVGRPRELVLISTKESAGFLVDIGSLEKLALMSSKELAATG